MATSKRRRAVWQPDPPKKGPRAPTLLSSLVDPARKEFARRAGLPIDRERWRQAVGDRIAARTEPGWLKNNVLTVVTASAAWAQELSLLSEEIRRRLAEHGLNVRGLRFVVRDGAGSPSTAAPAQQTLARRDLPDALREQLEAIGDPELAAAIADAAGYAIRDDGDRASEPRPARVPRGAAARTARSGRTSGRGRGGS
jgi:hypothetical protein